MNKAICMIMLALLSTSAYARHSTLGFCDPDQIIEIAGAVKPWDCEARE